VNTNEEKHGNGTYYYQNGNFFYGVFVNDYKHGKGTLYLRNKTKHVGEWRNDGPYNYKIVKY